MKDKTEFWDKILTITLFIFVIAIIVMSIWFIIGIINMEKDHECYMMPDEQFFKEEKCKPYWEYRNDR